MTVKEIILYVTQYCPACTQIKPMMKKLTKKKGIRLNIVDVDKCGPSCDWVRQVPIVEVDGQRVDDVYGLMRSLSS